MFCGKALITTKQTKLHKKAFEKEEAKKQTNKTKHHDKAMMRALRQEQRDETLS
jgi:hypothetical protein